MQNVINVVKFMIKMETQLFNKYCENSQVKIASHIYKYTFKFTFSKQNFYAAFCI